MTLEEIIKEVEKLSESNKARLAFLVTEKGKKLKIKKL